MRKSLVTSLFVGLLAMPGVSQALTITPADAHWQDQAPTTNSTPGVIAEANSLCGCGLDNSGADSNKVDEINSPGDDPTINLTGGQYLLVVDGNHFPAWYLYDLSLLGWSGPSESITLNDFWPDGGSISHVSSYGTFVPPDNPPDVPEPATFSMLALGLAGLGIARRRSQSDAK